MIDKSNFAKIKKEIDRFDQEREDIIKKSEEKGLGESETEEIIQKLKRGGDIFEPRRGFISRI